MFRIVHFIIFCFCFGSSFGVGITSIQGGTVADFSQLNQTLSYADFVYDSYSNIFFGYQLNGEDFSFMIGAQISITFTSDSGSTTTKYNETADDSKSLEISFSSCLNNVKKKKEP